MESCELKAFCNPDILLTSRPIIGVEKFIKPHINNLYLNYFYRKYQPNHRCMHLLLRSDFNLKILTNSGISMWVCVLKLKLLLPFTKKSHGKSYNKTEISTFIPHRPIPTHNTRIIHPTLLSTYSTASQRVNFLTILCQKFVETIKFHGRYIHFKTSSMVLGFRVFFGIWESLTKMNTRT